MGKESLAALPKRNDFRRIADMQAKSKSIFVHLFERCTRSENEKEKSGSAREIESGAPR
jgi:hypothetical protein